MLAVDSGNCNNVTVTGAVTSATFISATSIAVAADLLACVWLWSLVQSGKVVALGLLRSEKGGAISNTAMILTKLKNTNYFSTDSTSLPKSGRPYPHACSLVGPIG